MSEFNPILPFFTVLSNSSVQQFLQTVANTWQKLQTFSSGIAVGPSPTTLTNVFTPTPYLTPSAVAANTTSYQTFSVTGLSTSDKVFICPGVTMPAGVGVAYVNVNATDTLGIAFFNNTAGSLTPTAGYYAIVAIRS